MIQSLYLTNNDEETLDKLKELGYHICVCCRFHDVKWLHYYYREDLDQKEFHGLGNSCENECKDNNSIMCIECALKEALEYKQNIHIFHTVEDIDNYIKSLNNL